MKSWLMVDWRWRGRLHFTLGSNRKVIFLFLAIFCIDSYGNFCIEPLNDTENEENVSHLLMIGTELNNFIVFVPC